MTEYQHRCIARRFACGEYKENHAREIMLKSELKKLVEPSASFMGVAHGPDNLGKDVKACIVGIPFDCGTHPFRIGSRQGPDAIREQSKLLRTVDQSGRHSIVNPTEHLGLIDIGNIRCTPGDVVSSFPVITQTIDLLLEAKVLPISLGGDGVITLPQLRALAKHYPDLVVLHLDAHTDTYPLEGYNTATTFTRAAEEGLLNVSSSFHIGARGYSFIPDVLKYGKQVGYQVVSFSDFDQDIPGHIRTVRQEIGNKPVFLCFDMDIFDPAYAPGVCTPEWGGLSAKQGLNLLSQLEGLNFVGFDINTVSPPHDIGGATAFLAATVVQRFFELIVRKQA